MYVLLLLNFDDVVDDANDDDAYGDDDNDHAYVYDDNDDDDGTVFRLSYIIYRILLLLLHLHLMLTLLLILFLLIRRRRRLNQIVPNPRKPRTADYNCSICNEPYQLIVTDNPWWAVYTHECPSCRKIQIPRIDITNSNNAIELDPNIIALYGEGELLYVIIYNNMMMFDVIDDIM